NVSDKRIMLTYLLYPFDGVRPKVEDADGKALKVYMPPIAWYFPTFVQRTLEPGEVFEIGTAYLALATAAPADGKVSVPTVVVEPGKYRVSYPAIGAWSGSPPDTGTNRLS